jgi:hypothetical protein
MITLDKISAVRCPFRNALNCIGAECGVWRWRDRETGFCGAGGPPADREAAAKELAAPPAHAPNPRQKR